MPHPIIIFTPGAWHTTDYLARVISILESDDYKCVAVSLPSVDGIPPIQDWEPDVAAVRDAVLKECVSGNDVVVCCHSYSGLVVSSALEGLGKAQREQKGRPAGVVRIAYVAALLVPVGTSLVDATGRKTPVYGQSDGKQTTAPDPVALFYHDLEPDEGQYWASKLKTQALVTFYTKSTGAAYMQIPSVYLLCEDDRTIPFTFQQGLVERAREAGANVETEQVYAGHTPFLSKANFVAEFIKRAARGGTGSV